MVDREKRDRLLNNWYNDEMDRLKQRIDGQALIRTQKLG
jgi:hypothetical protein